MTRSLRAIIFAAFLVLGACRNSPAEFRSDRIAVDVEGEGRDVVLVHGLMAGPQVWDVVRQPGFRYHRVQIKGFGGTPAEGNRNGRVVASAADEIARYIRSARISEPIIVGHSMGGAIGLMIAARHPEVVSKLVIVDEPPFVGAIVAPGVPRERLQAAADKMAAQFANPDRTARERFLRQFASDMTLKSQPLIYDLAVKSDPNVTASALRELIVTDLTPELAKIRAPTRVLYAQPKGVPLTEAELDAFYKSAYAPLKEAQLVRVPASAHYIMFDNPERFKAELRIFAGR